MNEKINEWKTYLTHYANGMTHQLFSYKNENTLIKCCLINWK